MVTPSFTTESGRPAAADDVMVTGRGLRSLVAGLALACSTGGAAVIIQITGTSTYTPPVIVAHR